MVDLAWEHADEEDHEQEGANRKNQHEDALHESSHDVLRRVVDLGHLCISLVDIASLERTDIFDDTLVLFELLLETSGELLHPADHLQHVLLQFAAFSRLFALFFVVVHRASPPSLFLPSLLEI